ncbi:MAG: hypothetical protein AAFW46_00255 [Pseudomonadota bacterium]
MSSRRGTRATNDVVILIGILLVTGAMVLLALPSEDIAEATPVETTDFDALKVDELDAKAKAAIDEARAALSERGEPKPTSE